VKQKRTAVDKQTAFLEFKDSSGKPIESAILQFKKDIKDRRNLTKTLTEKINHSKKLIDKLQGQLDKKEEERKQEKRK